MPETTPHLTKPRPASRITARLRPQRSAEAAELIRRAPMSYFWNQIGSLWLFLSSFIFTLLATRGLGKDNYGTLAIALTTFNTAIYVAAFGLEDATTVFLPRVLSEEGRPAAASLIRRTLFARLIALVLVAFGMLLGIRLLADVLIALNAPGAAAVRGVLAVPGLDALVLPIVAYTVGTGFMNQLTSIFTSLLQTRLTLIVGGLSQVFVLLAIVVTLHQHLGISGMLWGIALVTWGTVLVYFLLLSPWWAYKPPAKKPAFGPVLRLSWSAWQVNLISSALLKQVAVSLLLAYAVSRANIGYFNLAFQLTHAAAYLLIAGLGGVGLAAMSAAYSGGDLKGLAFAWRAVSKVQILLAVPLLTFCFIHANAIAIALYTPPFAPVGPLMQVFLVFNILQRIAGGGAHQAALYVLGRQRLALITQWAGLVVTVILAIVLIPMPGMFGGAAGALIAVGIGQVGIEFVQLAYSWRLLKSKYPFRFGVRVVLALIPPVLVALVVHPSTWGFIPKHIGPIPHTLTFISLAISTVIFTAVLLIGLSFAKPIEHEDVDLLAQANPRLRPILSPFASGAPSPMMMISKIPTRPITEEAVAESLTPTARRERVAPPVVRQPIEPRPEEL
jgi:O-antigen/teichoic acid export membrane protein